jgi:hypothetical protein
MIYLQRKNNPQVAHLWDDNDTYCRMWSTGGLKKRRYHIVDKTSLNICTMCNSVFEEYSGHKHEIGIPY